MLSLLDIAECARTRGWTLEGVAGLYFALSARLAFEQTLTKITALPQTDRWGSMARASMRDDLYAVMIELTATVAGQTEADAPEARIEAWLEQGGASTRRTVDEAIAAATAQDGSGLATLSVAVRRLRSLVR